MTARTALDVLAGGETIRYLEIDRPPARGVASSTLREERMHTGTQRKPSERAAPSRSAKSRETNLAQRRDDSSVLPIHSAIDPQTISRQCACGGHCPACQAKSSDIKISQPNDSAEIEADRIADNVMRAPAGKTMPAANSGGENTLRRKPLSSNRDVPSQSPAHVRDTLSDGGQPLDDRTQNFFGPRLGYDLSNVRVHTGSKAGQSAQALNANAYTLGNDIVFGNGKYQPNSDSGKRLIAHELAHVAQANASSTIRRDTIYRDQMDGQLAQVEAEIRMLNMIPIKMPFQVMRLRELEMARIRLLSRGAGAPPAKTIPCTAQDNALKISQLRGRCLTVITRWRLYKEWAEYMWQGGSGHEQKLSGVAAWSDYLTQEEFDRLDKDGHYHSQYDRYLKFYAGGGQYERYKAEREAEEAKKKPPEPAPAAPDPVDSLYDMRQIDLDNMQSLLTQHFGRPAQSPDPTPPVAAQSGCHADPYARKTGGGTTCGQKRPDEATRVAQKALETPGPDLSEFYKEKREQLDRLNAAHLQWSQTGYFPWTFEFSPYEIQKDRLIPVEARWDIYNKGAPNNLENADYNEYFFRTREEYDAEFQRRHNVYLAEVKKCGHSRPSHFDCRNKVMGTYYPVRFSLYDAAAVRTHNDMQIAMPVLRSGSPVAGFTFHAAHEWLGWSTERSAAAANFVGGVTNIAGAKVQQHYSNRNAGQGITPRDTYTPPSQNVATAPTRDPVPPPGTTTKTTAPPPPVTDPWAGTAKIDVTNGGAFPPPKVEPPAPIVTQSTKTVTPPPTTTTTTTTTTPPPPPPPTTTTVTPDPKDSAMRKPPGGGRRGTYSATDGTRTQHKESKPVIIVLPRTTVPMTDFEEPPPGHYIKRKPPDAETQRQILAMAGRTTDGRLRDTNTGRALNDGEAVWGHAPDFQFKTMRDMAEKAGWTQEQFDAFFRDPKKWQIEYGPTNSGRTFDRVPRQRPVH
jgi:hypothetical protein